jgi:hypothetical protein
MSAQVYFEWISSTTARIYNECDTMTEGELMYNSGLITTFLQILIRKRLVEKANEEAQKALVEQALVRAAEEKARIKAEKARIKAEKQKEKVKTISVAAFNTKCPDACAICFDTHLKSDSVTTGCNHEFGKDCLNHWLTINKNCPVCRTQRPSLTCYKVRATKKKPLIIEIDDDEV